MIARTNCTAISHPLMSPTGTDSDSEQSREQGIAVGVGIRKCQKNSNYNFPDVVQMCQVQQINKGLGPTTAQHNTLSVLRTHSVDLLSSESDADVSHAKPVALVESNTTNSNKAVRPCKKGYDDISSLDSISNHSFDNDEDHNLASLSPTSSLADGLDDYDNDNDDYHENNGCDDDQVIDLFVESALNQDTNGHDNELQEKITTDHPVETMEQASALDITPSTVLPQYSAVDERRNSRNWQKITLTDGRMYEIDMRVIEPYKRVLSHGGYLKAGGYNAIVIFCACHLPDRSRADYSYVMDNLFLYVVNTLEQLVTDDYVLIYLHGGCNRRNVPSFPWLKKCYQLLDRRLRKSLKNMYLVHPTFWVKSIVWMARPFVSVKFWRKLVYVKSLDELGKHVAVEKAAIPEKVKQYDAKHT